MERIKIDTIFENKEQLISFVSDMQLNVYYEMPETFRYKWMKIEIDNDYLTNEVQYCWSMEYNYKVSGAVGYIFPTKGDYVVHFKTENGAKRNLIKRFERFFNPIESQP